MCLLTDYLLIPSEAAVGLERTLYSVNEDVGAIEVCVVVYSPETPPCPIAFAFNVSLSTGILYMSEYYCMTLTLFSIFQSLNQLFLMTMVLCLRT